MRYLVNSREMKNYDTNTIEQLHVPGMVLMERAALSFAEELKHLSADLSQVLVVCGTGNNGGDGLAIARLLKQMGCLVDAVLVGNRKKSSEQNICQQKIMEAYHYEILDKIPEEKKYSAVIDAVFGVGLSRNIEGDYETLITCMNELPGEKYAVDIASGVSADNGAVLGVAFKADVTITFAYGKVGMYLFPGNEYSGKVIVKEIGIRQESWFGKKPSVAALEDSDLSWMPKRKSHSNKGSFGKLLVIAGSVNMAGAACLCGKAAYATGCGLVRILTPEENRTILQTVLPEAILTTYPEKKPDLSEVIETMKWADAIVLGPGIGKGKVASALVECVIKNASVPVVLDADALNLVAEDNSILLRPHTEIIVTPHLGEMSRLTGDGISYIQTRLLEVAEEFARQYNVICVLKDEHTVTSVPYEQTYLNFSGNNGMATAGSGDVLSGIIGSLLVQGMRPEKAAPLGVFLHGKAGDKIRESTGTYGMLASDLIEGIRQVTVNLNANAGKTIERDRLLLG